ncbi:PPOX class F420-dependent oxidoreductase [Mycobacterium sp. SMC-2]|uniref:PPOX class F420-dependent oxidoreductase n=1 Tax=Mycobacterium sp. SMC-2 TaxID=2857058 RepID=UPI0021B2E5F9|nr:PPOX class F420-dependent oxidoreductase [Mycobacterium sp. SMC-2]UXA06194.1 PPOX class F420-dependent oxidoreductase [Mycobacterium sp. SMC-2]
MSSDNEIPIPEPAQELLTGLRIGYISTMRPDGRMSVVPVGVVREGDVLKISTLSDRQKVRNLERDQRITVCVPDPDNPRRYVEIRGVAELADDANRAYIDSFARQYMGVDKYPYDPPGATRTTITVRAERVSMPKVHGSG